MEREPDFKGHCTVLSVRVRTRACSSLTDQVTPLISSRFARKLALNAVPVSSALPSSKERPAQSPLPTRLRRRAVAPAAVRCVQFSGAWRMGLGGPWSLKVAWPCRVWTGTEAAPRLGVRRPQTGTGSESRARPGLRPRVWPAPPGSRSLAEGCSGGSLCGRSWEEGHQLPWRPAVWSRGGRKERACTVGERARPSLGRAFPVACGGPGGSALFSGHPDAFTRTFLCRVGGGQEAALSPSSEQVLRVVCGAPSGPRAHH